MQTDGRFRFDNYVVGSANRLAVAAARAVAEAPGTVYNPLFVYSSSGLGKTHLLGAVGHRALQLQPGLAIEYVSVDEFESQLHAAIAAGQPEAFKSRYAHVDVLLIDDVQFLTGRRETQSEMLRLFNALQGNGRQIVMASDRPPSEIADVDERLVSRLSGGLIVDIGAPDYETRVAILRGKAGERSAVFEGGVLEELASVPWANVRELQGGLNRLIAVQGLDDEPVVAARVRELVGMLERLPTPAMLSSIRTPAAGNRASSGSITPRNAPSLAETTTMPAIETAPPQSRSGATEAEPRQADAPVETRQAGTAWPFGGPSASGGGSSPTEYSSFLSDIAVAVAQHVEPWKVRVAEALAYWSGEGYRVTVLERALQLGTPPDVEGLLGTFSSAISHLRSLQEEAEAVEPELGGNEMFRDPERIADAEALVERALDGRSPPPGPSPGFTRDGYDVGQSNQLAVRAADAVAAEPGRRYNPLFIHGPSGAGKTHLAHAAAHGIADASGGAAQVAVVGAQTFVDELIAALQDGSVERWRARYRAADALIVDDVHFVAGKERTQEELFHVFNALHDAGKQIILTSDRHPKELGDLEQRLQSRFEGGLVVEIAAPDRGLREKLNARFFAQAERLVAPDLVAYLADRPAKSAREIAGTVQRLMAAADIGGVELTLGMARAELDGAVGTASVPAPNVDVAPRVDPFFLDDEKVVWDWPDVGGRAIEELK